MSSFSSSGKRSGSVGAITRKVFLGSLVAVVGLALAIVLLRTNGVLLWGLGLLLGVGGILVLLLVVLLFATRIPILGDLTGWLLAHVPPKVWVLVALLLFGLAISAGERAHQWAVRTFTNDVQIEAEWVDLEGDSPTYKATVYNHTGRIMSFDCAISATPVGEPGLEMADRFYIGPLPDDTSRAVRGEVLPNHPIDHEVKVLPDLSAECKPA